MLEFLRQISHKANYLLIQIFAEVEKFANSKSRNKNTFTRDKGSIAFNLGLIQCGIESFTSGKDNWVQSVNHSSNLAYRFDAEIA